MPYFVNYELLRAVLFACFLSMPRCVSLCVRTHTYIGAGNKSNNSFAVSEYAKQVTLELLSVARKLSAFGPNRLDDIHSLER